MKKGLSLPDGSIVNLETVTCCFMSKDRIELITNGPEHLSLFHIVVEGGSAKARGNFDFTVPVQEFHRIQRQITEYMDK